MYMCIYIYIYVLLHLLDPVGVEHHDNLADDRVQAGAEAYHRCNVRMQGTVTYTYMHTYTHK